MDHTPKLVVVNLRTGAPVVLTAEQVLDYLKDIPQERMSPGTKHLQAGLFQMHELFKASPSLLEAYGRAGGTIQFYNYQKYMPEGWSDLCLANYWNADSGKELRDLKRSSKALSELKVGCITINTCHEPKPGGTTELEHQSFLRGEPAKLKVFDSDVVHELSHFADESIAKYTGGLWHSEMPIFRTLVQFERHFSKSRSLTSVFEQENQQFGGEQTTEQFQQREVFARMGENFFLKGDKAASPIIYSYFEKIVSFQLDVMNSSLPEAHKERKLELLGLALADKGLINSLLPDEPKQRINGYLKRAEKEELTDHVLGGMYIEAQGVSGKIMDKLVRHVEREFAKENGEEQGSANINRFSKTAREAAERAKGGQGKA